MRHFVALIVLSLCCTYAAKAQPAVELSGLGYLDYAYLLASPDGAEEGENGFGYRRIYLTTDFAISDRFDGRVRLEARDNSTTEQGRPAPFIKDAFLRWRDLVGEGHHAVFGLSPPPVFRVSERIWGYRSLEATLMDRAGVAPSRDMGVALAGPLTAGGVLRYGVMVANNSGVRAETDRYKRAYGQLEWNPAGPFVATLGGDYAGYGDERTGATTGNAFVGYAGGTLRAGAELFVQHTTREGPAGPADVVGASVFAAVQLAAAWEAVGRIDRIEPDGNAPVETFAVAGLAYRPHPSVWLVPNLLIDHREADDTARVTGRLTLRLSFPD